MSQYRLYYEFLTQCKFLETAVNFHKIKNLRHSWGEIGTTLLSKHYGPTGIAQTGRFVPPQTFQMAVEKSSPKHITSTQDVANLYRKARNINLFNSVIIIFQLYADSIFPMFCRRAFGPNSSRDSMASWILPVTLVS